MSYAFDMEQIQDIEDILTKELVESGVHSVLLIDMAGNIVATLDNGQCKHDVYSLAALAAGNFGAVSSMAKIVGEDEFSLLFHKGESENIHFSKVNAEFLLITLFGADVTLGFLRLKVAEAIKQLLSVMDDSEID
ncbi:roadblock/LC7 domain-containing protein [Desulfococcaceae bacterium HSG7]|nr:roadblock/LC7 domain-containing protein [Desulfococcaceae bacterium HSG9]MDM8555128.1 roadblock/LC7 domain-containing protein [Desulfococcaceae bacterium HSG7]